jgi:hypothetical protein
MQVCQFDQIIQISSASTAMAPFKNQNLPSSVVWRLVPTDRDSNMQLVNYRRGREQRHDNNLHWEAHRRSSQHSKSNQEYI